MLVRSLSGWLDFKLEADSNVLLLDKWLIHWKTAFVSKEINVTDIWYHETRIIVDSIATAEYTGSLFLSTRKR
jgi:hypothetical protein